METVKRIKIKYRYSFLLLKEMVATDFKLRYQGSALGYLWTLLRPLAIFAILYVVFVKFLRIGEDVPFFSVYLLLGIVLWNYFIEVTSNGLRSVVDNGDILRKLSFPRYVIVLATSFSAFINLILNLLVVSLFMIIANVPFGMTSLLIVVPIIELFILALGLSFLLSALYVRFRDVGYIWEVILQGAFYATPILYPISRVVNISETGAKLMMLNPIAQLIQDARSVLITKEAQTVGEIFGSNYAYFIPLSLVFLLVVFSSSYFRKKAPYFAEDI